MADLIDRDAAVRDCEAMMREDMKKGFPKDAILFGTIAGYLKNLPAVNRWIPCSERMPENGERVLVRFRNGTVHIAVWYGDFDEKGAWKVTSQFPTKLYRTTTIPHWMPLPDAYEPPESEE